MALNGTVASLYANAVAARLVPIDPRAQRRIFEFAVAENRTELATSLLTRPDICAEVLDAAKKHPDAAIAAAWYSNPNTPTAEVVAQLRRERRATVLVAACERDTTPTEVLCELAANTESVKVATALLHSMRLPLAPAHRCATMLLARNPPTGGVIDTALRRASNAEPLLPARLMDDTPDVNEAAKMLRRTGVRDVPSALAAFRGVVERSFTYSLRVDGGTLIGPVGSVAYVARALIDADRDRECDEGLRDLLQWCIDTTLTETGGSIHASKHLRPLRELLALVSDPCAEVLATCTPDASEEDVVAAFAASAAAIAQFRHDHQLAALPRARSLERFAVDVISAAPSCAVHAAAFAALAETKHSLPVLLDELANANIRMGAATGAAALTATGRRDLVFEVANVCDDPEAMVARMLASPAAITVALKLDGNGQLEDRHVDLAARHARAGDLTLGGAAARNTALLRITARLMSLAAAELGDDPCAWDAFESSLADGGARFGPDVPVLEVARVAAAVTDA